MEYVVLLEKKQRFRVLIGLLILYSVFILFSFFSFGLYGCALSLGLLFFITLMPILYGRYKLFLFLWILVVPFLDPFRVFLIGGTNPFTYLVTGLTFPVALLLFYKEYFNILKELPFLKYLLFVNIIILLSYFRPYSNLMEIFTVFRFHFLEMFIVFATYFYIKKYSYKTLFNWISILAFINSIFTLFQKVTGIGLSFADGVARPGGIMGHANGNGFFVDIYLPLAFYMFLNAKTKYGKIFLGGNIIFCLFTLIMTMSKSSIIAFVVSLLILFFYLPLKNKIRLLGTIIAFTSIFLIVNFLFNLNIIENIILRLNNQSSFLWRFKIWNALIGNISFSTIFFGNGVESVAHFLQRRFPGEAFASHNLYLQFLYEYGILGLLYLLNFAFIGFKFIKASLKKNYNDRYVYLVPFSVLSSILIISISDVAPNSARTAMYCAWIIIVIFFVKLNSVEQNLLKNKGTDSEMSLQN